MKPGTHIRPAHAKTVKDPICGMEIDPGAAAETTDWNGARVYFCSSSCAAKFRREHEGKAEEPKPAPSPKGAQWTCPMHPEIVRDEPGSCPICGMALEPKEATAEEEENPELRDMMRRFWVSVGLTLPLLVVAMGDMLLGGFFSHLLGRFRSWAELALATPVVLWAGWPFFIRGMQSVRNLNLNMFTLISLGVGVAYAYTQIAQRGESHVNYWGA